MTFHPQNHASQFKPQPDTSASMLGSLQESQNSEVHAFFFNQHQIQKMEMSHMYYTSLISDMDEPRKHFEGLYSAHIPQKGLFDWLEDVIFSPSHDQFNKYGNEIWDVKRRLMIFFSDELKTEIIQKASCYLLGTYLILHSGG
jgi:hypothetical protein